MSRSIFSAPWKSYKVESPKMSEHRLKQRCYRRLAEWTFRKHHAQSSQNLAALYSTALAGLAHFAQIAISTLLISYNISGLKVGFYNYPGFSITGYRVFQGTRISYPGFSGYFFGYAQNQCLFLLNNVEILCFSTV